MMKYRYVLSFLICTFLFFIPFFWFKPGEMDLGGDSSRLYFYEPLQYLNSNSLYSISHSGLGGVSHNFFGIPFFLILACLKNIFSSQTYLIAFMHGTSLSAAFLFSYLSVKELLTEKERNNAKKTNWVIEISSIISGLYYIFAPVSTFIWSHMLLTDNLIFINPLIFYLVLKYIVTRNIKFIMIALIVTFIFAANFSYIGAPSFFSFFPLAMLFLILYIVLILHKPLPWKGIFLGIVLFFIVQAFHLLPQIESILTPGSPTNDSVFSEEAKIEGGMGYFKALAQSAKPSISLAGLQQLVPLKFFSFLYILFPFVIVLGFLWNKRRLMLLTGVFFIITFFFVTANITSIGLSFYTLLFHIPGFSMFRVFFGQWEWVYLFFYMLLLGESLSVVLVNIKKWQATTLVVFIGVFLFVTSWPFITGEMLQYSHWQSKNVSAIVDMDPQYEEMLEYIRKLPVDGKILSLPLTDPGYQVVKGENNAAYEGPSTITYIAGRNEFMGYVEFESFGTSFLQAAQRRDYPTIRGILLMLNVRYIYYNEDPYIYEKKFPGQPYIHVRNFLPDTQKGYKEFVKGIGAKEIKKIGKFHVLELSNEYYLPHIYAASKNVYWGDYLVNHHIPLSFYEDNKRVAFYDDEKILARLPKLFDDFYFKAQNRSTVYDFFKVKILPRFVTPTVSQKPSSFLYPLALIREKLELKRYKTYNDRFIDKSVYFIEKRVNELKKWSGEIKVLGNVKSITLLNNRWTEPKFWEIQKHKEYDSWEITLVRYERAVLDLIDILEKTSQSGYSVITNKVELRTDLIKHKDILRNAVREDSSKTTEEKKYLISLIEEMYLDIFKKLDLHLPEYGTIPYEVNLGFPNANYEVYLNKGDVKDFKISDIELVVDGKKLTQKNSKGTWIRFDDVKVKEKTSLPISLKLNNFPNIIDFSVWETLEKNKIGTDSASLNTTFSFLEDTSGLVREFSPLDPKSIYVISFDYKTFSNNFLVSVYEKGGAMNKFHLSKIYDEKIRSKNWKNFNTILLSGEDANAAFVQINKDQEDIPVTSSKLIKQIEIKNFKVNKIPDPKIFLKKSVSQKNVSVPQITFKKINPTKYKVIVRGSKNPYTFVLSEKFSSKWKVFYLSEKNNANTLRGVFSRLVGKLLSGFFNTYNIVISQEAEKNIMTSHFNGSLSEGGHANIFLGSNSFETFGQDPIAEETHLPVNGYANGWSIVPKDVENKENYELVIEMTSQKIFYGSLIVSLFGLLLVVFIFFFSIYKSIKR